MDSDGDENCLVIDESIADMEVSSTSETPAPKNVSEMENHNENEADSSIASTFLPTESTAPVNLSTKKSTHHQNGDLGRTKDKNKDREKEKYRHREKRRSKDERRKTQAPEDKHRSVSRKPNCISLKETMFKEKVLNITVPKYQLYSMRFSYRKGLLTGEMPSVYPAPPVFPDLNLTQLLNWPDIKIMVNLEYLKFSREIKQNCERDLVFGDILTGIKAQKNHTETRYIQKAPTTRTYPLVSKDVLDAYVSALMEAAPQYKVGPSKLSEIESAFRQMLNDFASVPYSSIQTRIPHSRFPNQYKYFCTFNASTSERSGGGGRFEVRLRETINPEVIFAIEKCAFITDQMDDWQEELLKHMEQILVNPSSKTQELLNERFKRCLSVKCEKCNETFEGALLAVTLKNHIKLKHFVEKQWTCVKCHQKWDQFELLNKDWKHDC